MDACYTTELGLSCHCFHFKGGIAVGIYRFSEFVSIFNFYRNIHVHIAYYHCAKDQIENRTPKMLISRFKCILYD